MRRHVVFSATCAAPLTGLLWGQIKECIHMYLCVLKLIQARCLCKSECYNGMEMNIQNLLSPTRTLWSLNHSVIHLLNYYLELQWPYLEMNLLLCNPTIVTQLFIISMDKIPIKFLKIIKKSVLKWPVAGNIVGATYISLLTKLRSCMWCISLQGSLQNFSSHNLFYILRLSCSLHIIIEKSI